MEPLMALRRWFALVLSWTVLLCCSQTPKKPPNILWITSEDNGPHLGAYGDTYSSTPNLDKLASRGVIYRNAWSNAPVCAPARTAIISGMHPQSTGSEHMRSMTRLPDGMMMFPQYLRDEGFYCTNNAKEDYNLEKSGRVWDDSSKSAHWRNRPPGQPFFAVFNFVTTHESQIRKRPHEPVHDPASVRVPAYHPDTPEVRRDWAQYYDKMTEMDSQVGRVLQELEEDGLTESTIIFYYGDHGPGMPRSKRWPFNSGLHVPLIVFCPESYRHLAPENWQAGGRSRRLVSFVDLAPTVLSLAGVEPPEHMQGQAFLGEYVTEAPPYVFGFRGRMDERYDLVRVVRDERYVYIRNYMPHEIYGQYIDYMFQTPTTQTWKKLYDQGTLEPPQTHFWESKPPEELYDLETDPDEVINLAGDPSYLGVLESMREAQRDFALRIRDVGFLPEGEIHSRSAGSTPYEMGHDDGLYPMAEVMHAAELASSLEKEFVGELVEVMKHQDSAVRYWGAMGILMRGADAAEKTESELLRALSDPSPYVRIVAAEAVGMYGDASDLEKALSVLLEHSNLETNGLYVSMLALNALDALGDKARSARAKITALPIEDPSVHPRMKSYVPRLIDKILDGPYGSR
jgi:uncharacterized sulfatase